MDDNGELENPKFVHTFVDTYLYSRKSNTSRIQQLCLYLLRVLTITVDWTYTLPLWSESKRWDTNRLAGTLIIILYCMIRQIEKKCWCCWIHPIAWKGNGVNFNLGFSMLVVLRKEERKLRHPAPTPYSTLAFLRSALFSSPIPFAFVPHPRK